MSFLSLKSTLINSVINEARKALTIRGRTSRKQYFHCCFIILNLALVFAWLLRFSYLNKEILSLITTKLEYPFLVLVISIYLFFITLTIRRVHDIGHGGWFILLKFIPILGFFVFLYIFFRAGNITDNKYGSPVVTHGLTLFDKIWIYSFLLYGFLPLIINSLNF